MATEQAWLVVAPPSEKAIARPELLVAAAKKAGVPNGLSAMVENAIDWFRAPTTIDWVTLPGLNAPSPA